MAFWWIPFNIVFSGKRFKLLSILSLSVLDAPVCSKTQDELLGALKHETLTLKCEVDASPPADTFQWTFNSSGEPTEIPARLHSSEVWTRATNISFKNECFTCEQNEKHDHLFCISFLLSMQTGYSRLNYTPTSDLEYGTISCFGRNEIGIQKSPCIFQIVAAGKCIVVKRIRFLQRQRNKEIWKENWMICKRSFFTIKMQIMTQFLYCFFFL